MGLLATTIVLIALGAPPDPEAVRAALDRVLAERPYQTTLPGEPQTTFEPTETPDSSPPSTSGESSHHRTGTTADHEEPDPSPPPPDRSDGGGTALFWVIVCVLAILLLVWLASEWRGREKAVHPSVAHGTRAPVPAMPVVPLDEIDVLAAAGRYGEAIHLLLLRTIAALSKAAATLTPALTSREILSVVPFRAGARDALAGLVDAVEVSLFGGRPVGEPDYRDCRARFDRFAELQSGRSA